MDDAVSMASLFAGIAREKRIKKQEAQAKIESQALAANPNLDIDIRCQGCNSLRIKEIDGYFTCLICGLKNDIVIDAGQEWRYYGSDDRGSDPARCDIPTNELLPKSSMGAMVGYGGKETATTKRIRNMSHWYAMPYKESTLLETFNNITIMAQNSGLNQCIIEEAKYMYKLVADMKASRRTKKEGMKAGSISLACKLKGVPRNCDEIARICHIKNNKTLRKSIKTFEEIWNLIKTKEHEVSSKLKDDKLAAKLIQEGNDDSSDDSSNDNTTDDDSSDDDRETLASKQSDCIPAGNSCDNPDIQRLDKAKESPILSTIHIHIPIPRITSSPVTIATKSAITVKPVGNEDTDDDTDDELDISDSITRLHRFISKLGLDDKIFDACKIILELIEKNGYLDKHNPLSRTAAAIFYINERYQLNINRYNLMQICGVSDVTINKCYQKLMFYKNVLNKSCIM